MKKTNQKQGLEALLNKKILPAMAKFAKQKHLNALRNTFVAFLPFVLTGSLGIVISIVLFGGLGGEKVSFLGLIAEWSEGGFAESEGFQKASDILTRIFFPLFRATVNHISIYAAFLIGYSLSKIRDFEHPLMAGLTSLAAFIIATIGGNLASNAFYFRAEGLLTAILVGLASTEILVRVFKSEKLKLTMPSNVPQGVANSFKLLIPIFITLTSICLIQAIVLVPTRLTEAEQFKIKNEKGVLVTTYEAVNGGNGWSLADTISIGLQAPFTTLATLEGADLGIALLYVLMVTSFWFFGIHGAAVMNAIFLPIWQILTLQNAGIFAGDPAVIAATNGEYAVFAKSTFDAFIWFGGAGGTLALLLATMTFSRNKAEKEVAIYSTPAGIFNINEPVIFGYPIILNPFYVVPFILGPMTITIITWLFLGPLGAVQPPIAEMPWVAPIGIGALFATAFDYKAFLLALGNFVLLFFIYLPFVLLSSRNAKRKLMEKASSKRMNRREA